MKKSQFLIPRMDCPSEERIIRMKFDGDASIKKLDFDIPKRSLVVFHEGPSENVLQKLKPLNFGAELVSSEESSETLSEEDHSDERRVLILLLAINGFMFVAELAAGIIGDSMGLISDSFDMIADASVYAISLFAVGKSLKVKRLSARVNGSFQVVIGLGILYEVVRRFQTGSDPEPSYMILVSLVALAANVYCLYLLSGKKDKGVHMKASYICSSTDVMANGGVILAGAIVYFTGSPLPDLIIGLIVTFIVLRGAWAIFKL